MLILLAIVRFLVRFTRPAFSSTTRVKQYLLFFILKNHWIISTISIFIPTKKLRMSSISTRWTKSISTQETFNQ